MTLRKLLSISALVIVIDQVVKLAVKGFSLFGFEHQGMQLYESHEVLGDFFRITFVENPGMAFGLNFGMPVILSLFSVGASLFLVYLLRTSEGKKEITGFRLALALILGGAVGNLIDRVFYAVFYGYGSLFYGKVVDFADFNLPDIDFLGFTLNRFYVFNIADAAVSVGVVLLLFFYPKYKELTHSIPQSSGTVGYPHGISDLSAEQPAATMPSDDSPAQDTLPATESIPGVSDSEPPVLPVN